MARSLPLDLPGAIHHVTARGARQGSIFLDDLDRASWLAIVAHTLPAYEGQSFAFCLMGDHYHLVLLTHQANLSALMHRVNTRYSLAFNRRHGRRGHLLERRIRAVHVDRDATLLEVCRHVDLNPVRAGLVGSPGLWPWSSYRAHTGVVAPPHWLATAELHRALPAEPPGPIPPLAAASRRYADWVEAGRGASLLRHGTTLGDDTCVDRVERAVPPSGRPLARRS